MKPNILFMISHDSGRRLGNYGYRVDTPSIQALAQEGVQFNQYYCAAPQCSPSRGSILTGLYPHNNGLMGLAHLGFSIDGSHKTLPMLLQKEGYETTLLGLSHETINEAPPIAERVFSSTLELGYEKFISVPGDRAPKVADKVIEFLENYNSDKPFYLNVGFFETHRDFDEYHPYADPVHSVEVFDFLPDTEKTREDVSLYNGSAKVLDQAVGRIRKYLKDSGLDKNTIIIFTTDHGVAFPGAKGTLKSAGLETALVIVMPDGKIRNIQKEALLCNIDIMPTILDLINGDIPKGLDGKSFAHLLSSKEDTGREEFFTELTWHDQYHPMRGIRTKKYSYVKNFEDGPKVYITVDAHLSLSGEEMREKYYVPNDIEELYDLEKDPLEEKNVMNDPAYEEIAKELRSKVENWMEETCDPLLKGPVAGVGSSRWPSEIEAGRAYPGREKYMELNPYHIES